MNIPTPSRTTTTTVTDESGDSNERRTPLQATTTPQDLVKREALDAKILYSLYRVLSPAEDDRISSWETTMEMWDRLQVTMT